MGKAKTTLCLLTGTGLTLQFYHPHFLSISNDSSPIFLSFHEKLHTAFHGVIRSARAVSVITVNAVDYKYSLHKLPVGSEKYRRELSEVHLRSAKRILKLCEANKGFYVKAGQFVAAMRQVPKEYSSTLSSLQDQAVPCQFKAIQEVLMRNLKHDFQEAFLSVDEHPIAAASIAQVHRAVLKDFQEVAIKVQYPGLEQQMKLDTQTMSFLSKSVAWFLPEYRFDWLVTEFVKAISVELDFVQEGRNSEKCATNLRNNQLVKVPRVFWDLTTNEVLTMQFHKGHKVDDVLYLKERGIDPIKVAKALVEVFAEMIFVHGFVHGDPHPGNILVSSEGQNGFSLVLLDHGVYKQLDEEFRLNYCQLWKALILLDSNKIQFLGEQFGVGKYSKYFPVIFTGRTIDSKSGLGRGMSTEEKRNLKQELKSLTMEDISSFMELLPPDFFTILRTDGLLRSNINKLGAPQQVRLLAYAKYAIYGLSPRLKSQYDYRVKAMIYGLSTNLSYLKLKFILGMLDLLSWLLKVRNFLYKAYWMRTEEVTMNA